MQDWRNGISRIFANGGDLAKKENGQWVSTLSDANTLKGLAQLQDLYRNASKAPADAKDATPWLYINDTDEILDEAGKPAGKTSLAAATVMAPGWAHWSIGDLKEKDGKPVREWNDKKFSAFVLPGNDGKPAPVFGRLQHRHLGQEQEPGPRPRAAQDHLQPTTSRCSARPDSARPTPTTCPRSVTTSSPRRSRLRLQPSLTPAAPGWAAVEAKQVLEEFFGKIRTRPTSPPWRRSTTRRSPRC